MDNAPDGRIVDSLTLRFSGENEDGSPLHELRAAHVAEVLQGIVGFASDLDKAGLLHADGPSGSEVLVRPVQQGSFEIEVVRWVSENWTTIEAAAAATGIPSLGVALKVATKSMRAKPKDFEHLDNGNVKILWQDDTADEVSAKLWDEFNKGKGRRKKHLRKLLAPLSDPRVEKVELAPEEEPENDAQPVQGFTLTKDDYNAVAPDDETEEKSRVFETEAQMAAIDFQSADKWRVETTTEGTRTAAVEDDEFLGRIKNGLAIRATDIFRLSIREEQTKTNERTRTKWFITKVEDFRRSSNDDDAPATPS